MREFNMEVASTFLLMAATLRQIKSRMMLPKRVQEEDEEEDPRIELVRRILEYRKFKTVSGLLTEMAQTAERYIAREPIDLPVRRLPPGNLSLAELMKAFRAVLAVKADLSIPSVLVTSDSYRMEDKMEDILSLLQRNGSRLLFSEAFLHGTRNECIASFLALLELLKLRMVTVYQSRNFSEIYIAMREEAS